MWAVHGLHGTTCCILIIIGRLVWGKCPEITCFCQPSSSIPTSSLVNRCFAKKRSQKIGSFAHPRIPAICLSWTSCLCRPCLYLQVIKEVWFSKPCSEQSILEGVRKALGLKELSTLIGMTPRSEGCWSRRCWWDEGC